MNTDKGHLRSDRVNYIDNLRIFLIILVVFHHQAIGFGAPGGWYYVLPASPQSLSIMVLSLFVIINQAFFMSLFFFVSAYFTPRSLDKKGIRRFLGDRLKRLGIPLLVYFLLLNPTLAYMSLRFRGETDARYLDFMFMESPKYFGCGPLWFVFALLIFTGVYAGIVLFNTKLQRNPAPLNFPSNYQITIFILAVAFVTFLVRMRWPLGTQFLSLQLAFFPLYIAFFVFGIQACRGNWLSRISDRQSRLWSRIAIALIILLPGIFAFGGSSPEQGEAFRGGLTVQSLMYVFWETVFCIAVSIGLLALFRRRFNGRSALSKVLSDGAYTVYIIHSFFVVAATYIARDWTLPPLLSVLLVTPPVIAACFFAAHFLRKAPPLNQVL